MLLDFGEQMTTKTQAFADLTARLSSALDKDDWEAIAELDEACSALVATLQDEDAADSELRIELEVLAGIYRGLQAAGRLERERLASELTKLSQSKQVTQAYKPLG